MDHTVRNILILGLRVTFPFHFANAYELCIMDDLHSKMEATLIYIEHHKIVRLKVSEPEMKIIEIDAIMVYQSVRPAWFAYERD